MLRCQNLGNAPKRMRTCQKDTRTKLKEFLVAEGGTFEKENN